MKKILRLFLGVLACAVSAHAVSVVPYSTAYVPFYDNNGNPLSGGFVCTYDAGTLNPRQTYKDSTGTAQNPACITLNAGGFANIWLANQAYKFIVQTSAHVQLWSVDNYTGYFGLLNSANTWTLAQTFTLPITILATDNQIITGAPGNQTTADFPPPTGNQILHFPSTTDTIVGRNTTDTLTNKTLTSAILNMPVVNGVTMVRGPATYLLIANANPVGTTVTTLTKFFNAPSQAIILAGTDTTGSIGICVSGCGNTGNAIIQQSGDVFCAFDGPTFANHYVKSSATSPGFCQDAGATPVSGVQVIGQIYSSNVGSGTYVMDLFPPGIVSPFLTGLTLPNEGATGTLANGLAKQTGAPTNAIKTSITDTTGAIGIVTSGSGIAGSASIQQQGPVNCAFDGATTANDYVILSTTTAGNCHDSGTAPPTLPPNGKQVVGQVLSTNVAGGTFLMNLYGPGIIPPVMGFAPQRTTTLVNSAILANTQTIVLSVAVTFPSSPSGTYRADVRYGMWATVGANLCAAEAIDTTNSRAFALSGQNPNGSGFIGLSGSEISSQTYAAGATATFTAQINCNAGTTITAAAGSNSLSPNSATYLSVTPLWSN